MPTRGVPAVDGPQDFRQRAFASRGGVVGTVSDRAASRDRVTLVPAPAERRHPISTALLRDPLWRVVFSNRALFRMGLGRIRFVSW